MPLYTGDSLQELDFVQAFSWTAPLVFPGTKGKLAASLKATLRLDPLAGLPKDHQMGEETEVYILNTAGEVVLAMERNQVLEMEAGEHIDDGYRTDDYIELRPYLRFFF